MKIESYEGLNWTPAAPLAMRGVVESIDAGLLPPTLLLNWDQNAFVAFEGDKPVGVLVWSKAEWQKEVCVIFGYVLSEFRRRGVYRSLWDALVARAVELKMHHIRGETRLENQAMRRVAKSQRRAEQSVSLFFEIPREP